MRHNKVIVIVIVITPPPPPPLCIVCSVYFKPLFVESLECQKYTGQQPLCSGRLRGIIVRFWSGLFCKI